MYIYKYAREHVFSTSTLPALHPQQISKINSIYCIKTAGFDQELFVEEGFLTWKHNVNGGYSSLAPSASKLPLQDRVSLTPWS